MSSVIDTIKEQYRIDAASGKRAVSLCDVPLTYEMIDPEWFTQAICEGHPGAIVTSFTLGAPNDGTSNRRRVTLSYNDAGRAAGLPRTVFCKAAMGLENRLILGTLGGSYTEVNFYKLVRNSLNIDAPVSLHAHVDPRSLAYILVMHDLTDDVHFCTEATAMNRARAESMVQQLAGLHAKYLNHPNLGTPSLPFANWTDWWPLTEKLGFERSCAAGLEAAHSVVPAELLSQVTKVWDLTLASVSAHNSLPKTLMHTDCHFSNWYLRPDDRMGLCDWQFVQVGHWSRDLIFALTTALTVEQRREWLPELIGLYLERMRELGAPETSFDETFKNCRQQLFSALAFWTFTLRPGGEMPDMHSEERLLVYIGRMAQAIVDLESLASFN